MRHAAARLLLIPCSFVLSSTSLFGGQDQGNDTDQHEAKTISRSAERFARSTRSERVLWVKELETAFPNRVGNPTKEDEYGQWFTLVAGNGDEWRRIDCANTPFASLFDKVVQRLELGPVPSIRRSEFLKYARRSLVPAQEANSSENEEADKVFRVLDRDGDGVLATEEWTAKLRDSRAQTDLDGNGRIDRDEYRAYFRQRVAAGAEAIVAKATAERNPRGSDGKNTVNTTKNGVPDWFGELDSDKDGQIALHEWRKAGRELTLFMEMDLDNDGLLTKEEYLRYARLKEQDETNKRIMGPPEMGKQAMK
jgi:Ca2+-binding EF-hand superfamily protein